MSLISAADLALDFSIIIWVSLEFILIYESLHHVLWQRLNKYQGHTHQTQAFPLWPWQPVLCTASMLKSSNMHKKVKNNALMSQQRE